MTETWVDQGDAVEVAAMSPAVVRLLRGYEACYRGPCRHGGPQIAEARDLRSMCRICASASAAFVAWIGAGPCSACGASLSEPPALVWLIESHRTGTTVAVRLCGDCQGDLTNPDDREDR